MFTQLERDIKEVLIPVWQNDWNRFARDVLKVDLDPEQKEILRAVQTERRVSVRSGNARGKDFVAAVASLCFLILNYPSKVINTAPTGRQVISIMLAEILSLYKRAQSVMPLGGRPLVDSIVFEDTTHYLLGFKAGDKAMESWSGFHSPNIMVVVTEASGIDDITFNAVEGILQGNSRLMIVFNPNRLQGEAYRSTRSPLYRKFRLNCLNSPNVKARKIIIPGQVDWQWIDEKVKKPGWVTPIDKDSMEDLDFEWEGKYYRPGNLFRIKVLGEFPTEDEDTLVPLSWIETANQRYVDLSQQDKFNLIAQAEFRLGADIAGMGTDNTVYVHRWGRFVEKIQVDSSRKDTVHMETAGKIKNKIEKQGYAFIDTIGEGAGTYSRLREQGVFRAISAKASYGAGGLTDITGERKFYNMRAYLYWAIRDALDPSNDFNMILPPDDELTEELTVTKWKTHSTGAIIIEPKADIKEKIGRSPDKSDALSLTFFPERFIVDEGKEAPATKEEYGFF